jgi:hypothetical protein
MGSRPLHHYGIWTAIALTIALASIYVGALIMLSRSQKDLAAQAAELAAEVRREESMQTLGGLLRDLSADTMKLDAFFVAPEGAVGVIEEIEALSLVVGVPISVADVRIQDQDPATGEGVLSMDVAAAGSWRSMTHLLALLDALPFQSELDSATLTLISTEEEASAPWSFRALLLVPLRR